MNKVFLIASTCMAFGFASPALATNPNDGNIPGCNPSGSTPQKCDEPTGPVITVPVTSTSTSTAVASSTSSAIAAQQQGQVQGQSSVNTLSNANTVTATGGNATGGSSSSSAQGGNSSTNGSGNSTVTVQGDRQVRQRRVVATAYAPIVVGAGGSDSCLGSASAGGQTGLFGLSFGGTTKDEACRTIKLSRRAEELGMPDVACQILGLDPKFAEGLKRANRTCDISNFAARMVPVQATVSAPEPVVAPVINTGERG